MMNKYESTDSDLEIATESNYLVPFFSTWVTHKRREGPVQGNRMRNAVPLSIMDNIDTLRRGLMRELALRRLAQERHEMVKTSEELKNSLGKR
jgi:hypothetical protein